MIRQFLTQHADMLREQGCIVAFWRKHKGKSLGPYFALRYREGRRQKSVYLGSNAELAAETRAELARLQEPLRRSRTMTRARQALRRALARARSDWDQELMKVGLRRKGSEIRGWREAGLR